MTLVDTGPLVALVNRNDPNHAVCLTASAGLPAGPLLTTWPCLTKAMHLVYRAGGYPAQAALRRLRSAGRPVLHDLSQAETDRMAALMDKYRDTLMDLADASLVVAGESHSLRRVSTLDSDFRVYRLAHGTAFEIVP